VAGDANRGSDGEVEEDHEPVVAEDVAVRQLLVFPWGGMRRRRTGSAIVGWWGVLRPAAGRMGTVITTLRAMVGRGVRG